MKKYRMNPIIFASMILFGANLAVIPQAAAESSMLIQLNEKLNKETQQVKVSLDQLRTASSHQHTAARWAAKSKSMPRDSKDFAYARAAYSKAMAADLEQKFETVTKIYRSARAMTDTIDRLTDEQKNVGKQRKSLFSSKDSVKTIRAKAKQLKGINNMFVTMLKLDPGMQNRKLRWAYRAAKLNSRIAVLQGAIPKGKGIGALQRLKDSTESITYLAKAYLNGLKYQADIVQIIAIGGESNTFNTQAANVMGNAFDVLNPDGLDMQNLDMMLGSIGDDQSSAGLDIQGDPGISDDIDALEAKLISQAQQ